MRKYRNVQGFTLVELIVVIAIIGVLAGILVPTMLGYVKKANKAADLTTAKKIYEEVQMVLLENPDAATAFSAYNTTKRDKVENGSVYTLVLVCSMDGRTVNRNDRTAWSGGNSEAEPFRSALNTLERNATSLSRGSYNFKMRYGGPSNNHVDRWMICYRLSNPELVEIWAADSERANYSDGEPIFRLYPNPDPEYLS